MKTTILSLVITVFTTLSGFSQSKSDTLAIINTAKDYFEGWYTGDTQRMSKAMHADLAKRHRVFHEDSQKDIIYNSTKSVLIEYTRSGYGKETPFDSINLTIEIYDIFEGIASVKITSIHFIDYAHLVKFNNEWKIINVLWTDNKERKEWEYLKI